MNAPVQVTETLLKEQAIRVKSAFKFSPALEQEYREFHRTRHLMPRIIAAAATGFLAMLSPFYEFLLDAPSGYGADAFFIQSITMLLPALCVILIMLSERGKKHTELCVGLIVLCICMGMFAERRVGLAYDFVIPFAFPCAVVVFGFVLLRLRLFTFLPIALLAVILHTINELTLSQSATPTFYNVVFIWIMFFFGAGSAYNLELRERQGWLSEQMLSIRSSADHLTQLANKRGFEQHLESAYLSARRGQHPLTLLIADIDHFKKYNDEYGHQQGDQCLAEVAAIIGAVARRSADLAARIGGEEFALVLYDTDARAAKHLADKLQAEIKAAAIPHSKSPTTKQVTLSIGGSSCIPGPEFDEGLLLEDADRHLYAAKNAGRNQVKIGELI